MIVEFFSIVSMVSPCLAPAMLPPRLNEFSIKPKISIAAPGRFRVGPGIIMLNGRALSRSGAPVRGALDRLKARFQCTEAAAPPARKHPASPYMLIGLAGDNPALNKLKATLREKLPPGGLGEEGYLIEVAPERVLLTADKSAGVFYGIQRLLELATDEGLPCGRTADWPALGWRGMHVGASGHASMPDLRKLIDETLPALRLNHVILEINYDFQYRSHPELVSAGALTLEDCRELRKIADRNFVQIIPMINCLGHQSWAKQTFSLLKTHPDFDETPNLPQDNPGIYCRSWCPSNPDVNRVIFALMDELIDAFGAKAFHVGMDEVFLIGECPRCKDQDHAALFAKSVNDLHSHLVDKRRVEMLMWGDRLLDGVATKYGKWEASENGTYPAIDLIPKDIVMCDWHYETPAEFPSVPYFQEKGFRILPSGWNRVENVNLLTNSAFRHRGPRMLGYLATTWGGLSGVIRALNGEPPPPGRVRGNVNLPGAIRAGARIAWEGLPAVEGR